MANAMSAGFGGTKSSVTTAVNKAKSTSPMNIGVNSYTPTTNKTTTTVKSTSPANTGVSTYKAPTYSTPSKSTSTVSSVSTLPKLYNDTLMNNLNAQKEAKAAGMTYKAGYSSLGGPEGYKSAGGYLMVDNEDGSKTYYNTDTGAAEVIPSTKQLLNYGNLLKQQREEQEALAAQQTAGTVSNGGVETSGNTYYDDLLKAFMEQNDAARQSMIDAIMSNLSAVKGEYKNQIQKVINDYQDLINANEVNRERTRRKIRENQANRGQLDSGLGRQERLNLDTTYDSQNSQLASARESAVNEIMNLIAQAEAEANSNKASVEQNYNNALLQFKLANS